MKLTPYKGLDSEPSIRYLYTGREYNIETRDYYYRYRVMDPSVGRFISKDNVNALNRYFYADDDPVIYKDQWGLFTIKIGFRFDFGFIGGASQEVGIAFGFSKECGFTVGVTVSNSGGVALGATVTAGSTLNFNPSANSVNELAGTSLDMNLQLGSGLIRGGGVNISDTGLSINISGSGIGVGGEYTNQIIQTDVQGIGNSTKGKCK